MGPAVSRSLSARVACHRVADTISRQGKLMGDLLIGILSLAGYVVPAPALIWGWWRWSTSSPRFGPPKWRTAAGFCGLLIASIVGVAVLICSIHVNVNGVPTLYLTDVTAIRWGKSGFFASAFALVISLSGKGPSRLPACLASVGLMVLWMMIPVVMY